MATNEHPTCLASFFLAVAIAFLAVPALATPQPAKAKTTRGSEYSADAKLPFPYLLYEPATTSPKQRLPLIVYLHGGGERGNDLDMLRRHGPPLLFARGTLARPKDFILVAPQCPTSCRSWSPTELRSFIDALLNRHAIDSERITVTGQSMGGIGAIALLGEHPERFAGGIAICGRGTPHLAKRLVSMPLWLFHGSADTMIPVSASRELSDQIRKLGGKLLRYDELTGEGHMIHNDIYSKAEIWEWLLSQKRASRS